MPTINREKFLEENTGLIKKVVNKYHFDTPKFSYDDLVAVGNQAALKALDSFDEDRGNKPQTYVYWAIDRDIRDFVRKNKHDLYVSTYQQRKHYQQTKNQEIPDEMGPHSPVALRLDYDWNWENSREARAEKSLSEIIPSGEPPPEQKMIVEEQKDILLEEINRLPESERTVVRGRYFEGATFVDLGLQLGVTKQRAKQIEQKAFKTLKRRLSSRLGEFIARPDGLARRTK